MRRNRSPGPLTIAHFPTEASESYDITFQLIVTIDLSPTCRICDRLFFYTTRIIFRLVSPTVDDMIRTAISNKTIIEFNYHGYQRIAEPHVYGINRGKAQLLVFQIGGTSSSGGLPEWRRVDVDQISDLTLLAKRFPGRRPNPSGAHSAFDVIFAIAD